MKVRLNLILFGFIYLLPALSLNPNIHHCQAQSVNLSQIGSGQGTPNQSAQPATQPQQNTQPQTGEPKRTESREPQSAPAKASDSAGVANSGIRITFLSLKRVTEWDGVGASESGDMQYVSLSGEPGRILVVRYKVSFGDRKELPRFTHAVLVVSNGSKFTTDHTLIHKLGDHEIVVEQPFFVKPSLVAKAIQIGELRVEIGKQSPRRKR